MLDDLVLLRKLIIKRKSFEDHAGRPGKVGGSLPKGQGNVKAPKE